MDIEVASIECSFHQNNQTCKCLELQDIKQSKINSDVDTDKDSCRKRNRASLARQCFAALIGKFIFYMMFIDRNCFRK